jgi:hypothetical protein
MPIVRVVTPTDPQTDTITAFQNELMNKVNNWASVDYHVYSANDQNSNLDTAVGLALGDSPDAILACGSMAAGKLQAATSSRPIIMVGAYTPANPQSNLTGFIIHTIGGKSVAQHQLDQLAKTVQQITVLYDVTNDPSKQIFKDLKDPQHKIQPLVISNPGQFATHTVATDGFMLIPNAMYFSHRAGVLGMVDNDNVKSIYFPEREYKQVASAKTQGKSRVHGHDLPATFRDAADIVASILNNPGQPLPPRKEGRKDSDD